MNLIKNIAGSVSGLSLLSLVSQHPMGHLQQVPLAVAITIPTAIAKRKTLPYKDHYRYVPPRRRASLSTCSLRAGSVHVDELARLRGETFNERVQQRRKAAALLVELVVVAPSLLDVGHGHGEKALSKRAASHCLADCPFAQMQRLEGDVVVRPLRGWWR